MNHSYLVLKFKKESREYTLEIVYCLNLHEASSKNSTDSTRISGEMVVKIHIRLQSAPGALWPKSAFFYIKTLMSNDSLKPWENKKGQTFVVVLFFLHVFFCCRQLIQIKKRQAKNEHHNDNLVFLVLSELYSQRSYHRWLNEALCVNSDWKRIRQRRRQFFINEKFKNFFLIV